MKNRCTVQDWSNSGAIKVDDITAWNIDALKEHTKVTQVISFTLTRGTELSIHFRLSEIVTPKILTLLHTRRSLSLIATGQKF